MSDIHISAYRGASTVHFRRFLSTVPSLVDPLLYVVTGDLTDAKDESLRASWQHAAEWETYAGLLQEFNMTDRHGARWLDLRGNHDCFNTLPGQLGPFESHAQTGAKKEGAVTVDLSYGSYSFVAFDAWYAVDVSFFDLINRFALVRRPVRRARSTFGATSGLCKRNAWSSAWPCPPRRVRTSFSLVTIRSALFATTQRRCPIECFVALLKGTPDS